MNEKDYKRLSFLDLVNLAKNRKDEERRKFLFGLANKVLAKRFKETIEK